MIDHAPQVLARQLTKRRARVALVFVALLALVFAAGLLRGHFERYASLTVNNEALVQCLNGHLVAVDDMLVSCDLHVSKLVADNTKKVKVTLAQAEVQP